MKRSSLALLRPLLLRDPGKRRRRLPRASFVPGSSYGGACVRKRVVDESRVGVRRQGGKEGEKKGESFFRVVGGGEGLGRRHGGALAHERPIRISPPSAHVVCASGQSLSVHPHVWQAPHPPAHPLVSPPPFPPPTHTGVVALFLVSCRQHHHHERTGRPILRGSRVSALISCACMRGWLEMPECGLLGRQQASRKETRVVHDAGVCGRTDP